MVVNLDPTLLLQYSPILPFKNAAEQADRNESLLVVRKHPHKPAKTSPVPPIDISGHPVLLIFNF